MYKTAIDYRATIQRVCVTCVGGIGGHRYFKALKAGRMVELEDDKSFRENFIILGYCKSKPNLFFA